MSSLADWEIEELAKACKLVWPYRPEQLNPASYDVVLGDTVLVEAQSRPRGKRQASQNGEWLTVDISEGPLFLQPGEFVLAHTEETVSIPPELEAIFCLKSSRGREGYNHALAAYIDPGFSGRITLELKNYSRYRRLPLQAGMRIGQLRFTTMRQIPRQTYDKTGRYQGAVTVEASKGHDG